MKNTPKQECSCKNVFKYGRPPTKEEYTRIWIDLINQIERLKAAPSCFLAGEEDRQ